MATVTNTGVSPAEYLEFERGSERKHEYRDGEIVQMVGGTKKHGMIVANLIWIISSALRHKDYEYFPSETRVKAISTGLYTYPDVTVVKNTTQLEDEHNDTILNPTAIFEVLSPSTESYDRGEKFQHYRGIESLSEYVLVSQDRICIERFSKQDDGDWRLRDYRAPDDVMTIDTIECAFPLADVYHKVPLHNEPKSGEPPAGQ